MAEPVRLVLHADVKEFIRAMDRAAGDLAGFQRAYLSIWTTARAQRRERPDRSRVHAAYDRRRRARRRRR